MTPEELAQALADHFEPPHFEERRRTDLKAAELRKLPIEERYERVFVRKGPDDTTQKLTRIKPPADEPWEYGGVHIGARSYREVAEAALGILGIGVPESE